MTPQQEMHRVHNLINELAYIGIDTDLIMERLPYELPEFKELKLEAIATGDKIIPLNEFQEECQHYGFIDYDGFGVFATKDGVSDVMVKPSEFQQPWFSTPDWATHVVWYNR